MKKNDLEKKNRLLDLAAKVRRFTDGMCRVGIGPYGFGVENDNPAQIGMTIRLKPDPFGEEPQPLEEGKYQMSYPDCVKNFIQARMWQHAGQSGFRQHRTHPVAA